MRKRKRDGERKCKKESGLKGDGPFDDLIIEYSSCWQAMLWGLSEPVYEERNKVAVQKCAFIDEEKYILATTPKKNTWDLPFFVQHVTCARKIMLGH